MLFSEHGNDCANCHANKCDFMKPHCDVILNDVSHSAMASFTAEERHLH